MKNSLSIVLWSGSVLLLSPLAMSATETPAVATTTAAASSPTPAPELVVDAPASPAEQDLQALVVRQNELFAAKAKNDANFDDENFRTAMQQLANDYDDYLKKHHDYAPGYAAYGFFLWKVEMRKQSISLLLKANDLLGADAKAGRGNTPAFVRTWALVKNEIGNYLAEEGKPLQAVNYFTAAIELTPNEPLYHYQLGTLLSEAREDFIRSGQWQRPALERAMHLAFQRAAELAPDRFEFTYRYAESFYDMDAPDWNEALKAWAQMEEKAPTDIERQTMRLHAANILIMLEKYDHARTLLATVTEEALQGQKKRLTVKLPKEGESKPEAAPAPASEKAPADVSHSNE